jgi:hypothetical protein
MQAYPHGDPGERKAVRPRASRFILIRFDCRSDVAAGGGESLETWRELAIRLFPDHAGIYAEEDETVWQVFFDLQHSVVRAHEANDVDRLEKIYSFAEWCHTQKGIEPEYWTAAYAAFYEHLGEKAITYYALPNWVKPAVFKDILGELEDRLDNKEKYPFDTPGSFKQLLEMYDAVNGTSFAAGQSKIGT